MAFAKLSNTKTGGGSSPMKNIAIKVTGFDLDSEPQVAIGIPIEKIRKGMTIENSSEEAVRFFLRKDSDAKNRRFARREIKDLANVKDIIGTTVLFEGAYWDGAKSAYNSRWTTTLTRRKNDIVARRQSTVRYNTDQDGAIRSVRFDTLLKDKALLVSDATSADELQTTLSKMLERSAPGSTPMVSLRLVSTPDADTGDMEMVTQLYARARSEQDDAGNWTRCDGARSAELFMNSNIGEVIKEEMKQGNMHQIELIPGHSFNVFSQTRDRLMQDNIMRLLAGTYRDESQTKAFFDKNKDPETGRVNRDALLEVLTDESTYAPLYRDSFISVRQESPEKIYPIEIPKPADPNGEGVTLQNLVTEHIDPAVLNGVDSAADNPAQASEAPLEQASAQPDVAANADSQPPAFDDDDFVDPEDDVDIVPPAQVG